MITEDFVSFEIAKLLKEKGFPQNPNVCNTAYTFSGKLSNNAKSFVHNAAEFDKLGIKPLSYSMAPTLQMAMKWMREIHHYYIQVMLDSWACGGHSGYYVVIQKTDSDFEMMLSDALDEVFYKTPEDAAEAAIKYCLTNLI